MLTHGQVIVAGQILRVCNLNSYLRRQIGTRLPGLKLLPEGTLQNVSFALILGKPRPG